MQIRQLWLALLEHLLIFIIVNLVIIFNVNKNTLVIINFD
jgi:hypothetical protein